MSTGTANSRRITKGILENERNQDKLVSFFDEGFEFSTGSIDSGALDFNSTSYDAGSPRPHERSEHRDNSSWRDSLDISTSVAVSRQSSSDDEEFLVSNVFPQQSPHDYLEQVRVLAALADEAVKGSSTANDDSIFPSSSGSKSTCYSPQVLLLLAAVSATESGFAQLMDSVYQVNHDIVVAARSMIQTELSTFCESSSRRSLVCDRIVSLLSRFQILPSPDEAASYPTSVEEEATSLLIELITLPLTDFVRHTLLPRALSCVMGLVSTLPDWRFEALQPLHTSSNTLCGYIIPFRHAPAAIADIVSQMAAEGANFVRNEDADTDVYGVAAAVAELAGLFTTAADELALRAPTAHITPVTAASLQQRVDSSDRRCIAGGQLWRVVVAGSLQSLMRRSCCACGILTGSPERCEALGPTGLDHCFREAQMPQISRLNRDQVVSFWIALTLSSLCAGPRTGSVEIDSAMERDHAAVGGAHYQDFWHLLHMHNADFFMRDTLELAQHLNKTAQSARPSEDSDSDEPMCGRVSALLRMEERELSSTLSGFNEALLSGTLLPVISGLVLTPHAADESLLRTRESYHQLLRLSLTVSFLQVHMHVLPLPAPLPLRVLDLLFHTSGLSVSPGRLHQNYSPLTHFVSILGTGLPLRLAELLAGPVAARPLWFPSLIVHSGHIDSVWGCSQMQLAAERQRCHAAYSAKLSVPGLPVPFHFPSDYDTYRYMSSLRCLDDDERGYSATLFSLTPECFDRSVKPEAVATAPQWEFLTQSRAPLITLAAISLLARKIAGSSDCAPATAALAAAIGCTNYTTYSADKLASVASLVPPLAAPAVLHLAGRIAALAPTLVAMALGPGTLGPPHAGGSKSVNASGLGAKDTELANLVLAGPSPLLSLLAVLSGHYSALRPAVTDIMLSFAAAYASTDSAVSVRRGWGLPERALLSAVVPFLLPYSAQNTLIFAALRSLLSTIATRLTFTLQLLPAALTARQWMSLLTEVQRQLRAVANTVMGKETNSQIGTALARQCREYSSTAGLRFSIVSVGEVESMRTEASRATPSGGELPPETGPLLVSGAWLTHMQYPRIQDAGSIPLAFATDKDMSERRFLALAAVCEAPLTFHQAMDSLPDGGGEQMPLLLPAASDMGSLLPGDAVSTVPDRRRSFISTNLHLATLHTHFSHNTATIHMLSDALVAASFFNSLSLQLTFFSSAPFIRLTALTQLASATHCAHMAPRSLRSCVQASREMAADTPTFLLPMAGNDVLNDLALNPYISADARALLARMMGGTLRQGGVLSAGEVLGMTPPRGPLATACTDGSGALPLALAVIRAAASAILWATNLATGDIEVFGQGTHTDLYRDTAGSSVPLFRDLFAFHEFGPLSQIWEIGTDFADALTAACQQLCFMWSSEGKSVPVSGEMWYRCSYQD